MTTNPLVKRKGKLNKKDSVSLVIEILGPIYTTLKFAKHEKVLRRSAN